MSVVSQPKLLRDEVTLEKGKPPAQQPYFGSDAELYLTPEYLRGNAESEPVKPSANAVRVNDGETIVLWDGSNAGEIFRARNGILASTMSRIRHSHAYDDEYFFYALKGWEEYLKGQTSGSGIPHVDKEVLDNLELIEFPKPEQAKIAEVLSTVDRAIEQTGALIAKQQRVKTGLMQDLLTRGIDEHGNLRSEETHEFKGSLLGRIPVEWEVSPAHALCIAVIDCKNRTPPVRKDGHPVIRTPNARAGKFVFEDLLFTDSKSYEIWTARGKPNVGDVVITREAPFGEACIIPEEASEACLGQRMMLYQPNPKKLDNEFLLFAIYSEQVQKRLLELAGGSTVGHIRVGDIRDLSIPHPITLEEQERVANVLSGIANELEQHSKAVQKLHRIKTALMQDLLTGEKRVTPLLEAEQAVGSAS